MQKKILFNYLTLCFLAINGLAELKKPTHTDIRYSVEYDRSQLDLWLAESDQPTPWWLIFTVVVLETEIKNLFGGIPC